MRLVVSVEPPYTVWYPRVGPSTVVIREIPRTWGNSSPVHKYGSHRCDRTHHRSSSFYIDRSRGGYTVADADPLVPGTTLAEEQTQVDSWSVCRCPGIDLVSFRGFHPRRHGWVPVWNRSRLIGIRYGSSQNICI